MIAFRTIGSQIGSHWQQFIRLFVGIGLLTGSQEVVSSNPPRQLRIAAKPVIGF